MLFVRRSFKRRKEERKGESIVQALPRPSNVDRSSTSSSPEIPKTKNSLSSASPPWRGRPTSPWTSPRSSSPRRKRARCASRCERLGCFGFWFFFFSSRHGKRGAADDFSHPRPFFCFAKQNKNAKKIRSSPPPCATPTPTPSTATTPRASSPASSATRPRESSSPWGRA